jgi:predicted site-specific integrase-resolvase
MMRNEEIRKAIFNMGGPKIASAELQVSTSTIGKWIRNGVIPNLDKAKKVAEASGFALTLLRPRYQQETSM